MSKIIEEVEGQAYEMTRAGIRNPETRFSSIQQLIQSPALQAIVKHYLPGKPIPVRSILFDKSASIDWGVPWHQDLGYLEPDAEPTFMVNFWIPLVDATRENGCLEIISGSQRAPLMPHETGLGLAGNFKGMRSVSPGARSYCHQGIGSTLPLAGIESDCSTL